MDHATGISINLNIGYCSAKENNESWGIPFSGDMCKNKAASCPHTIILLIKMYKYVKNDDEEGKSLKSKKRTDDLPM